MPGDIAGHRLTRPEGLVQCDSMLVIATFQGMSARWPSRGHVLSEQAPNPSKCHTQDTIPFCKVGFIPTPPL